MDEIQQIYHLTKCNSSYLTERSEKTIYGSTLTTFAKFDFTSNLLKERLVHNCRDSKGQYLPEQMFALNHDVIHVDAANAVDDSM